MRDRVLFATNAKMLDPLNCGSLIVYKVQKSSSYFEAEVTLSDCNRMVNWQFDETPESLDKVDEAIGMLMQFRKDLVKGQKEFFKLKKQEDEEAKKKKNGNNT